MTENNAWKRLRALPGLHVLKLDGMIDKGIPDCAYVVRRDGRSGFIELKYGTWPNDVLGHGLTKQQAAHLEQWALMGGRARVLHVHAQGCVLWGRGFTLLRAQATHVEPLYVGPLNAGGLIPHL